jgi:hypothetical protein
MKIAVERKVTLTFNNIQLCWSDLTSNRFLITEPNFRCQHGRAVGASGPSSGVGQKYRTPRCHFPIGHSSKPEKC